MKYPTVRLTRCAAMIMLISFVASACATTKSQTKQKPEPPTAPGIYDIETGDRIDPAVLYDKLDTRRWIVVGESHDNRWHHEVQARIYSTLLERSDAPVALGMEMFQVPYQAALDAYARGEIDEATMLERTEFESRWGVDTAFYRPLWRAARQHKAPIVALNAPSELSRKVSKVGLTGLDEDEQPQVPSMDLSNQTHREYVRRAFRHHDMEMSDERFERFYEAQVLWDETMAETAANFFLSEATDMVIVAGLAHADARFGIPPRIERRLPNAPPVLTVRPISMTELEQGRTSLQKLRELDNFDYAWVGSADDQ